MSEQKKSLTDREKEKRKKLGKVSPKVSLNRKLGQSRLSRIREMVARANYNEREIEIDPSDLALLKDRGYFVPKEFKDEVVEKQPDFVIPDKPDPLAIGDIRVAAYVRVSTNEQSTSMQVEALNRYCDSRGWPRPYVYGDNATGVQIARKSLQELLKHVVEKRYTIILCWKLDRIARSMIDLLQTIKLIHAHGCTFVSMTENLDFSTPAGRLMFNMLGAFAEFESSIISERVVAGQEFARSRGKLFGASWKHIDVNLLLEFRLNGLYFSEIATLLGVSEKMVIEHFKRVVMPKFYPGADINDYQTVGFGQYRPFGWAHAAGISAEQIDEWRQCPAYLAAESAEQRRREVRLAAGVAYKRIIARSEFEKANRERKRLRKEKSGNFGDWKRDRRALREALTEQRSVESGPDSSWLQDGGAGGDWDRSSGQVQSEEFV